MWISAHNISDEQKAFVYLALLDIINKAFENGDFISIETLINHEDFFSMRGGRERVVTGTETTITIRRGM